MTNTLTTLRAALNEAKNAKECIDYYDIPAEKLDLDSVDSVIAGLTELIASMEAQPVAAWLDRDMDSSFTATELDGGAIGYLEPLYTHPAQPSEPKAEPAHDDLTIAYMSGFHDGRKAKTEPVQEPVAEIEISRHGNATTIDNHFYDVVREWPAGTYKLYATPQTRKPLTRDQIKSMLSDAGYTEVQAKADFINGIRHAEIAHGIEGGAA